MEQKLSRGQIFSVVLGFILLGIASFMDNAQGKPMQTRSVMEEPVSGSVLAGDRNLVFVVYQKQVTFELIRPGGVYLRTTLPASQPLLSLFSHPAQLGSPSLPVNKMLAVLTDLVEGSSVAGKDEIIAVLNAGRQK